MDVIVLLIFVSAVLVAGGLVLFLKGIASGDFEHGDRLSLLPLEEDDEPDSTDGDASPPKPLST